MKKYIRLASLLVMTFAFTKSFCANAGRIKSVYGIYDTRSHSTDDGEVRGNLDR